MGRFNKYNGGEGIPFMDGGKKLDTSDILQQALHVTDYGYIHGEDGEYVVLQFKEHPGCFAFGNSIVTEAIRAMEKDFGGKDNVLMELETATVTFEQKKNKKGNRTYTTATFEDDIPFN